MINIHTRDRLHVLERSLPKWAELTLQPTPINLIVEPNEVRKHCDLLHDIGLFGRIGVVPIPKRNQGMGNSRHVGYLAARSVGAKSFITTDDDLYPREGPARLLKIAKGRKVFGIGAYAGIYGMHMGLEPGTGVHATAVGFRCWAMNTAKVHQLGGMPRAFKGYDDHEVARQGMDLFHLPWYVDTETTIGSIGKIGDPGGMSSLPGMDNLYNRKHTAHVLSYQRWPDYVNNPARCEGKEKCGYMMQWKRFMADRDITI